MIAEWEPRWIDVFQLTARVTAEPLEPASNGVRPSARDSHVPSLLAGAAGGREMAILGWCDAPLKERGRPFCCKVEDSQIGVCCMRIAQVSEFYYPHLGGVTEHVHNLTHEFLSRGHEVIILTSNMRGQGTDPEFVRRVGTSRVLYSNGSFSRITTGWGLARRVEAVLRGERIDLVHVHCALAPTLGLLVPTVADRLGIPVVATFHSWFPRSLAFQIFRRPLQRRLDRIEAKIAVSEPAVSAVARYFRAEWIVIPNGVKVGYFHPNGRESTGAWRRSPRLLFLGRLDPRNGLDTLLAAMPRILSRHPGTRLIVAGDGPLRRYYEWRARSLGEGVRFVGRVYEERAALYGAADLYLCPTRKASFGITLLEAMACGTPIIGSDVTGFRELINGGQEAVLTPASDAAAWADAVLELIADPPRRDAMGAAGLAKAAQFAWPNVAQRILEVYRRVLG